MLAEGWELFVGVAIILIEAVLGMALMAGVWRGGIVHAGSVAMLLGFSAISPAYALAVRDLFPAAEAYWRVPTVLLCTALGMALGG